jgi:threonyl-tRNA synthetase
LTPFTEHLPLNKRFNRIPRTTEEAKRRDHRKLGKNLVVCVFTKVGDCLYGLPLLRDLEQFLQEKKAVTNK